MLADKYCTKLTKNGVRYTLITYHITTNKCNIYVIALPCKIFIASLVIFSAILMKRFRQCTFFIQSEMELLPYNGKKRNGRVYCYDKGWRIDLNIAMASCAMLTCLRCLTSDLFVLTSELSPSNRTTRQRRAANPLLCC